MDVNSVVRGHHVYKRVWTPRPVIEAMSSLAHQEAHTVFIVSGWVRILFEGGYYFISAKAIMRILFEGGYYSTCGYYSRKYGTPTLYTKYMCMYQH